jgi:hypothetical protein
MQRDQWHPSRILADTEMAILELCDRKTLAQTVEFYLADTPRPIQWEHFETLGSLLEGVTFHTKNKVVVDWDCTVGRVIRRNKTAFHVWCKSEKDIIETDKPTIALLLRGMVGTKAHAKLKRELYVIDLLAGNMYA